MHTLFILDLALFLACVVQASPAPPDPPLYFSPIFPPLPAPSRAPSLSRNPGPSRAPATSRPPARAPNPVAGSSPPLPEVDPDSDFRRLADAARILRADQLIQGRRNDSIIYDPSHRPIIYDATHQGVWDQEMARYGVRDFDGMDPILNLKMSSLLPRDSKFALTSRYIFACYGGASMRKPCYGSIGRLSPAFSYVIYYHVKIMDPEIDQSLSSWFKGDTMAVIQPHARRTPGRLRVGELPNQHSLPLYPDYYKSRAHFVSGLTPRLDTELVFALLSDTDEETAKRVRFFVQIFSNEGYLPLESWSESQKGQNFRQFLPWIPRI